MYIFYVSYYTPILSITLSKNQAKYVYGVVEEGKKQIIVHYPSMFTS